MTPLSQSRRLTLSLLLAGTALAAPVLAVAADALADAATASVAEVVVTSRHRSEEAQKVPVALSVIGGDFLAKTNTTNIAQLSQFVPSLQFSFFNPRNANINIRGIGNNIGLANDGIEPGVGFYVDGVYYDRPATATFDLIDIAKAEVLRGPQGTLFGKNTTAGAISLSTTAPSAKPEALVEVTGGNLGAFQAKAAVGGPILGDKLTGRLTFAATSHGGLLTNIEGGARVNASRNITARGQLLYTPTDTVKVRLIGDYSRQSTNCCDLVLAGVVSPPNGKNFTTLSQAFGYTPIIDPFSRRADTNSPIHARQETGGVSAQIDWSLPAFVLTSVTAARFWNWWPANDSDYTPLSVVTASQNGDYQRQFSQELRIASSGTNRVDYTGGLYLFREEIKADILQSYGNAATAFLINPALPAVIGTGYALNAAASYHTTSLAAFGQAVWRVTPRLNLTGGLRYTYDRKTGWFNQTVSGGAPLTGALAPYAAYRLALGAPDAYTVSSDGGDLSGLVDLSYQVTPNILTYATYSRGSKSGGLNLAQLPAAAPTVVAAETLDHYEIGAKTRLFERRVTLNADLFWEDDRNYQANIYDTSLGKQYLSNVPKVRSRGVEVDITAQPTEALNLYGSVVYDDAIYQSYPSAPCPLETINLAHCNLSGSPLAGTPEWTASFGGEIHHAAFTGAEVYLGVDDTYRSSVYSSATDSRYSRLDPLDLVSARLGLRADNGRWDAYVWSKNLLDEKYFTFVAAGVGNTGALVAQLGDPRSFGGTLRLKF